MRTSRNDLPTHRDLLIQSRFRNNILWKALEGKSVAEVCRLLDMQQSVFGELLNLRRFPVHMSSFKSGRIVYTYQATKIATFFKMLPEDMFPLSLYQLDLPRVVEHEYESSKILPLMAAGNMLALEGPEEKIAACEEAQALSKAMEDLKPKQRAVLNLYYGLDGNNSHSLQEVGTILNITTERVRQIKLRAEARLRYPTRIGPIAQARYGSGFKFYNDDDDAGIFVSD